MTEISWVRFLRNGIAP